MRKDHFQRTWIGIYILILAFLDAVLFFFIWAGYQIRQMDTRTILYIYTHIQYVYVGVSVVLLGYFAISVFRNGKLHKIPFWIASSSCIVVVVIWNMETSWTDVISWITLVYVIYPLYSFYVPTILDKLEQIGTVEKLE